MKLWERYKNTPLIYLNLGAFILGGIAGLLLYKGGCIWGAGFLNQALGILAPFGGVLVNMLKMIVIPIIFFSIVSGTAGLPLKTFGKMGLWVCIWYFCTSLYSVIFGTLTAFAFSPSLDSASTLAAQFTGKVTEMQTAAESGNAFLAIIYNLFANPFQALANGNFLAVIVFAILFGLAVRNVLDGAQDERTSKIMTSLIDIFDAAQKAMFKSLNG